MPCVVVALRGPQIAHPYRERRKYMQRRGYLLAIGALCACAILLASCGGSPTSKSTATPTSSTSSGPCAAGKLKGIFQFTGTPQVDNAALSGGVVIQYWSEIEPAEGQFNWAPLDQDIAQWTSHGKKVVVRIPFSSSFDPTHSATPQWVYNLGVPSVTEVDGSIHPQYWNPTFLAKLHDFIAAFGARYDGNPNIVYVNAAVGNDGETIVDANGAHSHTSQNTTNRLQLWQNVGYSDAVWWNTIQQILGFYKSAFTRTPLAVQVDETFIGGTPGYNTDKLLSFVVSQGMWLQYDAEYPGKQIKDPQWFATTLIAEPGENSKKQGSTLAANLQTMVTLGATYGLVFGSDLKDPSNQQSLACVAQKLPK